jgi:hypothetical protein
VEGMEKSFKNGATQNKLMLLYQYCEPIVAHSLARMALANENDKFLSFFSKKKKSTKFLGNFFQVDVQKGWIE